MMSSSVLKSSPDQDQIAGRRGRATAVCLVAGALAYALVATAFLPHRLSLADAVDVFAAGAVPGLVVTLLLWMVRPGTFKLGVRTTLVGMSLTGAASVAALPLILAAL
jgi:hypothetical protein